MKQAEKRAKWLAEGNGPVNTGKSTFDMTRMLDSPD